MSDQNVKTRTRQLGSGDTVHECDNDPYGSRTDRWSAALPESEVSKRQRLVQEYLSLPEVIQAVAGRFPRPAAEWVREWKSAAPFGFSAGPLLWLRAPTLNEARLQRDRKLDEERQDATDRRREEVAAETGVSYEAVVRLDCRADPRRQEYIEAFEQADAEVDRDYEARKRLAVIARFPRFSCPSGGFSIWRDASTGLLLNGEIAHLFVDPALSADELSDAIERLTRARASYPGARLLLFLDFDPSRELETVMEAAGARYFGFNRSLIEP